MSVHPSFDMFFTILALCTEFHEIWYEHYTAVCHVEWPTVVARRM